MSDEETRAYDQLVEAAAKLANLGWMTHEIEEAAREGVELRDEDD
jgi:hypothetical protein